MKKTLLLLLGAILLLGCVQELQATDCGSDVECVKDALEFCKNVKGFQEVTDTPPLEKGRTDVRIKPLSDTNCHISVTLSQLVFQKDFILQNLESSLPQPFTISDNYRNYIENLASFYVSRLNSIIQENLPITISCNAGIADGKVVTADLSRCTSSEQNKVIDIFQNALPKIVDELKTEIEEQESELKSMALKLGEINEMNYEQGAEKTDFYSEGASYVRAFVPTGAQIQVSEVSFDNLKVKYSISGIEEGSFAIVQGLVILESSNETSAFYQKAYAGSLSAQSSEKKAKGFHGPNSDFVKIKADSALDSYRLIYQEENLVTIIDLVPKEMDLGVAIEKLEAISNTFNKRVNPNTKQISLDCNVSSTYEEVCETVQELEEYQEEECSVRQYKYQATQAKGTYSEGLFGFGCYTQVETTISNQENIDGAFTFEVTLFDEGDNAITTLQDSKMVSPAYPQVFQVTYSYDCSNPRPARYTHNVQVPTQELCGMVTKTRGAPKEICEQTRIQEIDCKPK